MTLISVAPLEQITCGMIVLFCFPLAMSAAESMMVRAVLVTATSLALTGAVVAHAYLLKHQFYPTVVYLTKSSPSMAVRPVQNKSQILNVFLEKSFSHTIILKTALSICPVVFPCCQVLYIQAFVLVFLLGKFMRKVFFGQLRAAEMEVHFCLCSFTSLVFFSGLLFDLILPLFITASISSSAPGMQWRRRAWHSLCSEMTSLLALLLSSPFCFFLSASTGWLKTGWILWATLLFTLILPGLKATSLN